MLLEATRNDILFPEQRTSEQFPISTLVAPVTAFFEGSNLETKI